MRNLKQELSLALASVVFTDSQDANGMPILKLVASGETIFVKIEAEDPNDGRQNAVGGAQARYSPHKSTILRDSTAVSEAVRIQVLAKCVLQGTRVDIYEVDPLPSSYDLTGATLITSEFPDSINKLTDQQ
jgi:hypothetical protein